MSYKHFSIDLETFSTRADAVILAVGVTAFTLEGTIGPTFYRRVDWQSNLDAGRHLDPGTIRWWLGQSDAARAEIVKPGVSLGVVLNELQTWFLHQTDGDPDFQVWGNGASFDEGILCDAYRRLRLPEPWRYNAARDLRTLVWAAGELTGFNKTDVPFEGDAHRADHDSAHQARVIVAAYKTLKRGYWASEDDAAVFAVKRSAPSLQGLQKMAREGTVGPFEVTAKDGFSTFIPNTRVVEVTAQNPPAGVMGNVDFTVEETSADDLRAARQWFGIDAPIWPTPPENWTPSEPRIAEGDGRIATEGCRFQLRDGAVVEDVPEGTEYRLLRPRVPVDVTLTRGPSVTIPVNEVPAFSTPLISKDAPDLPVTRRRMGEFEMITAGAVTMVLRDTPLADDDWEQAHAHMVDEGDDALEEARARLDQWLGQDAPDPSDEEEAALLATLPRSAHAPGDDSDDSDDSNDSNDSNDSDDSDDVLEGARQKTLNPLWTPGDPIDP